MDAHHEQPEGWIFLRPDAVPAAWRDRAVPVALVPLLPGETGQVLGPNGPGVGLDATDQRLLALVAEGRSKADIAEALGLTPRSVERRIAKLRRRFDVSSTAELIAAASRRGFGGVADAT